MQDPSEKDLMIRATLEVVYGATEPIKIWLAFLYPNREHVAENAIHAVYPILFCCIRDLAEAPIRCLDGFSKRAQDNGFEQLSRNISEIALQCSYAVDFLNKSSLEDQIFLSLVRDRLVHGYLAGTSQPERNFKYVKSGLFETKKMSKPELDEMLKVFEDGNETQCAICTIFQNHRVHLEEYLGGIAELFVDAEKLRYGLENDYIVYFDKKSRYLRS